eukprot:1170304-Amphidinium_carterae.1
MCIRDSKKAIVIIFVATVCTFGASPLLCFACAYGWGLWLGMQMRQDIISIEEILPNGKTGEKGATESKSFRVVTRWMLAATSSIVTGPTP